MSEQRPNADIGDRKIAPRNEILRTEVGSGGARHGHPRDGHGDDTKYASHALRLGRQGVELVTTGWLPLPLRPDDRGLPGRQARRRRIRRGARTHRRGPEELSRALDTGPAVLPVEPDRAIIDSWLIDAHRRHWAERGL